jgi:hypothetical protein
MSLQIGLGLLQRLQGRFLAQMAQETQDQARADAQFRLGLRHRAAQAAHHRLVSPRRARCASADRRTAPHAPRCRRGHAGSRPRPCRRNPVLGQQHAGAGVVDVEEALQVGEGVGRAQRLHARVRQATPLRCASAKISSGSSEPSMWMCSSALGRPRRKSGRRFGATTGFMRDALEIRKPAVCLSRVEPQRSRPAKRACGSDSACQRRCRRGAAQASRQADRNRPFDQASACARLAGHGRGDARPRFARHPPTRRTDNARASATRARAPSSRCAPQPGHECAPAPRRGRRRWRSAHR